MKIIQKILGLSALAALILSGTSCGSRNPSIVPRTFVKPLGDTMRINDGSLIYALPMTVFNITVEFERTVEKPGPYARYASEMLGLKDVITHENERWAISRIGIESVDELDPSEFYVIESNTAIEVNALSLKKNGLIMDINTGIYRSGRMIPTGYGTGQLKPLFSDLGSDEYFISQSDTAYRVVKLDTAFVKIPYLVERKKPITLDQLAERAAKTLLELRDGKQFILTGEANVFPQSNAGIDEINRLEREYTALFAGKTYSETKTITYTFIPRKESAGSLITLFRFSESAGPADASSSAGTPVVVEIIPEVKIKDITIIQRPPVEGQPVEQFDKLFYRVPDVATVRIKSGSRSYYESRQLIYQFGQVVQLPANYIIGR